MKNRILVISHGHPDFSLGGAEIAAYNLFNAYQQHPDVEDSWFLARADRGRGATGQIRKRRENEYLWEQGIGDWHLLKAEQQQSLTTWFTDLIQALKPTIVHMHHYAHMGIEFIRVIKQINPEIRIFFTIHEYMAICKHNGQMVKTGEGHKLCSSESYDECHQCYPQHTAEDFWLRKHYIKSHFDLIEGFISPSEFLRQRYIQWGIDESKIIVIENGQQDIETLPPRELADGETRNRFAYFGQVNPYKGIDVLLQALLSLKKKQRKKLVVEIHGANLEQQTGEFQEKVKEMASKLIEEGCLRWVGPYRPDEQMKRMQSIDWVIVPSIWWENSPMVIQEAFVAGRPLIVSDIGGMAEKVRDGVDGVHFSAGNPVDLGIKLLNLSGNSEVWDNLRSGIEKPINYQECALKHLFFWGLKRYEC
ncbi:glycosyltransferase family 4 protein [Amphritea pacifica]|uniref:glycosyltransferase family 4 protein n=1 Tax=Amphritea pacifica TaxID=2811233 RepID=UPI0019629B36|nr:glycosyltransferase family 4 protein [Amphritea pacifica]MBN1008309.1 glycosyltransferase family 4 protein [Amphritea pacifica]